MIRKLVARACMCLGVARHWSGVEYLICMSARCRKSTLCLVTVKPYIHGVLCRVTVWWPNSSSVSLVHLPAAPATSPSSVYLLPSFVVICPGPSSRPAYGRSWTG
ncbi:hypothetical protein AAC387_Pa02g5079 [Persea americana]